MKRALIFSLAYYPHVGGAEVAIKEITDRIPTTDISFDLITFRFRREDAREEQIGNVRVFRVGNGASSKLFLPILGLLKTIGLVQKKHYDFFWVMMVTYAGGIAYAFNILHFWKKVPIVLTLQEGDSDEHIQGKRFGRGGVLWRFLLSPFLLFSKNIPAARAKNAGMIELSWRLAFPRTTVVTAISTYLKNKAIEYGYRGPIEVIPNAVDTKLFSQSITADERSSQRVKIGLASGDVALVTTSRLVHKNATDDVIRALALMPQNIHFIVYGIGPDEAFLKELAKNVGVAHRVHFMGQIAHTDLPRVLHACDIFIRPSRSEGMGNSFIEAMAAGVPVIATQEGGIVDFLKPGETGWAVDKDSPEQIAKVVAEIIAQPERVRAVTEAAQQMVIEKYDWDLIAGRMRALFDRVLAGR